MKNMNKKSLILALVAASLLTGCDDDTTIAKSNNAAVGTVVGEDTYLDKADLYDTLKGSNAGSTSLDKILETIGKLEYDEVVKEGATVDATVDGNYNVKQYRTHARFYNEIKEKFQDILDAHSYADEDGNFDEDQYIEYIEDSLDYDVKEGAGKYTLPAEFTHNYDEYIEAEIIPDIYEEYIYEDYVLQNSGRTSSFQSQKAMTFDVLKITNDTTKEGAAFTDGLVKVVKAITGGTTLALNDSDIAGLSFKAVDSNYNLIVVSATADSVKYEVFADKKDAYMEVYNRTTTNVDAIDVSLDTATETYDISATTEAGADFYKLVEKIQIARDLYDIDTNVVKARNYDFKNAEYMAYLSDEQDTAKSLADTFSSSNARSILKGAKIDKISAQQTTYYTTTDTYTSSEYTNVLPSAIYNLRESSAREFYGNLSVYASKQYLLPQKENQTSPVYLDSDDYYVCHVDAYYGLYLLDDDYNLGDGNGNNTIYSSSLSTPTNYIYKSDWEITAYRAGEYNAYDYNSSKWEAASTATKVIDEINADGTLVKGGVIDLVSTSVKQIVSASSSIKKEAIVELLEKYGLEINDQDVYDYINSEYPAYFEED